MPASFNPILLIYTFAQAQLLPFVKNLQLNLEALFKSLERLACGAVQKVVKVPSILKARRFEPVLFAAASGRGGFAPHYSPPKPPDKKAVRLPRAAAISTLGLTVRKTLQVMK